MRNYNWKTKLKTNKNFIKGIRTKIKKKSNEWELKLKYQKLRGQLCTFPNRREKRRKKKRYSHLWQTFHYSSSRVILERRGRGGASKDTTEGQVWPLGDISYAVQRARTSPTRWRVMSTHQQLFIIKK
jgi:hypothetical protein